MIAPVIDRNRKINLQKIEIRDDFIEGIGLIESVDVDSQAGPRVIVKVKSGEYIKGVWLKHNY